MTKRPSLNQLLEQFQIADFDQAGDTEAVLKLLTQALEDRPHMAEWAGEDPDLHWIRQEPRFAKIIRRAELIAGYQATADEAAATAEAWMPLAREAWEQNEAANREENGDDDAIA